MFDVSNMKALTFILLFCFGCKVSFSQNDSTNTYIDIQAILNYQKDLANGGYYFDKTGKLPIEDVAKLPFTKFSLLPWKSKYMPIKLVTNPLYIRLPFYNSANFTDTIYFFPGYRFENVTYQLENNQLQQLPEKNEDDGFVRIILSPKEKKTVLIKLQPVRRDDNRFIPQLIRNNYLEAFKGVALSKINDQKVFGILLSGILFTMIVFSLINFFSNKKKEFLYYAGFAICIFLLIFLLAIYLWDTGKFAAFLLSYFGTALLIAGTIFYSAFTRWFLDTKLNHKSLNILFLFQEYLLIASLAFYTYLHYFSSNFSLQYSIEFGMKIAALIIGVIYIVIAFFNRNWLMNYLGVGNIFYILFSIISTLAILQNSKNPIIPGSPLLYFEIGIVLAIVFFLIGLVQKNRKEIIAKTKEQEELIRIAERKELETQLAVLKAQQDERNRISADMHDDLGAGMTAIRLYSELAKSKTKDNPVSEIDKISNSANEMLNKMNAIIWSMSSSNDSLSNLVAYLRSYALEYLESMNIDCKILLPETLPEVEVPGDLRRNVFLVFKETLNNIVKHANATSVNITLTNTKGLLELFIQDNGKGIDMNNLREFGNGLKNMKKRMADFNIDLEIKNNNGTLVILKRQLVFPAV